MTGKEMRTTFKAIDAKQMPKTIGMQDSMQQTAVCVHQLRSCCRFL